MTLWFIIYFAHVSTQPIRDAVVLAGGEVPPGMDEYVDDLRSAAEIMWRLKDLEAGESGHAKLLQVYFIPPLSSLPL